MNIPITFEYQGKTFKGAFKSVSGGGTGSIFHLVINSYFFGQLFYTSFGWQFASNKNHFKGMADFFGEYISGCLDSVETSKS